MTQPASIVVAHAPIGSGHRIAAEAVAAEIEAIGAGRTSVKIVDILHSGRVHVTADSLTKAFTGPTAGLYDAIWFSRPLGAASRSISTPALAWAYAQFTRDLIEMRPAAVVCTHALPALLAARAVRRGRLATKVVCVTTDYGIHSFWPNEGTSLYCVAGQGAAGELASRGHRSSDVALTGIPVRPQFTLDYDRAAARAHFGFHADDRILLAMAGSTVAGPYMHFKSALATSLPAVAAMTGTTVVIVTGKDRALSDELNERAKGFGVTNVRVMGFVEQMAPLMAAADLGMAKPGGLVSAESLAMGLPLLLVGPAVGQERANAQALSEAGAARFVKDPRTIAEFSRSTLADPARLASMRASAAQLARPFAATEIAERILSLVDIKTVAHAES